MQRFAGSHFLRGAGGSVYPSCVSEGGSQLPRPAGESVQPPGAAPGPGPGRDGETPEPGALGDTARAIKYRQKNQEAVGGFFSQIGELYVVHHLWAYKDLQSREETRNAAWRKRGWDENVYYTVPLVRNMESRIMIPLKISPLQ